MGSPFVKYGFHISHPLLVSDLKSQKPKANLNRQEKPKTLICAAIFSSSSSEAINGLKLEISTDLSHT